MGNLLIKLGLKQRDLSEMHSQVHDCMDEFKALGLRPKEVYSIHDAYAVIDTDHSGTIEITELMKYLSVESTPFSERVFKIFDEDGSGEIDFREFVIAMWNYCTLAKNALIMFAFDLYDNDNSGQIDISEVEIMLSEVYGNGFEGSELALKILNKVRAIDGDPNVIIQAKCEITAEQFATFCNKHATLLWPAFTMQELLRAKIGGHRLWKRMSKRRFEISDGAYLNINQLLASHINFQCFNQIMEMEMAQQGGEGSFRLKNSESLEDLAVVIIDHTDEKPTFRSRLKSLASRGASRLSSRRSSRASSRKASSSSSQVPQGSRLPSIAEPNPPAAGLPAHRRSSRRGSSHPSNPTKVPPSSSPPTKNTEGRERQPSQVSVASSEKSAFGVRVPQEEKLKQTITAIKASGRISERGNRNKYKQKKRGAVPSYFLGQMGGGNQSQSNSRRGSVKMDQNYSLSLSSSNDSFSPQKAQRQRGLAHNGAKLKLVGKQDQPNGGSPTKNASIHATRRKNNQSNSIPGGAPRPREGSTASRVLDRCASDYDDSSPVSSYDTYLEDTSGGLILKQRQGLRKAARKTEDPFAKKTKTSSKK